LPRFRLLPRETYLATLKAEPSTTLADWIQNDLPRHSHTQQRILIQRYTQALARLLRRMHERSLSHRDLKSANILIIGNPEADPPQLSLIDLVGVERQSPLSRHRRIQNLARLHLSLLNAVGRTRTDGIRFLRAYLPGLGTTRDAWKQIWRDVKKTAGNKVAQNDRRGRPLT